MRIKNHLLEDITFLSSPNFNERPVKNNISLIVLHSISLPPTIFGNKYVEDFLQTNYLNQIINT